MNLKKGSPIKTSRARINPLTISQARTNQNKTHIKMTNLPRMTRPVNISKIKKINHRMDSPRVASLQKTNPLKISKKTRNQKMRIPLMKSQLTRIQKMTNNQKMTKPTIVESRQKTSLPMTLQKITNQTPIAGPVTTRCLNRKISLKAAARRYRPS